MTFIQSPRTLADENYNFRLAIDSRLPDLSQQVLNCMQNNYSAFNNNSVFNNNNINNAANNIFDKNGVKTGTSIFSSYESISKLTPEQKANLDKCAKEIDKIIEAKVKFSKEQDDNEKNSTTNTKTLKQIFEENNLTTAGLSEELKNTTDYDKIHDELRAGHEAPVRLDGFIAGAGGVVGGYEAGDDGQAILPLQTGQHHRGKQVGADHVGVALGDDAGAQRLRAKPQKAKRQGVLVHVLGVLFGIAVALAVQLGHRPVEAGVPVRQQAGALLRQKAEAVPDVAGDPALQHRLLDRLGAGVVSLAGIAAEYERLHPHDPPLHQILTIYYTVFFPPVNGILCGERTRREIS